MNPHPPLDHIQHLRCLVCSRTFNSAIRDDTCPDHGVVGTLDVVYDYDVVAGRLKRRDLRDEPDRTIWRYRPLLPVHADAAVPPLEIGWTPLYRLDRLAERLGIGGLWVKDEGRQPTASFKDRASALLGNALGADLLIISTAVEKVALNFGKPDETWLDHMSLDEARVYLEEGVHFAAGSMAPKIEAVIQFLAGGGSEALITDPQNLVRAVAGETGTRITK